MPAEEGEDPRQLRWHLLPRGENTISVDWGNAATTTWREIENRWWSTASNTTTTFTVNYTSTVGTAIDAATRAVYTMNDTTRAYWGAEWGRQTYLPRATPEAAQAASQRAASRTTAVSRAEELLLSLLTPEQATDRETRQGFLVVGSAGGLYRIRRGTSGNVDWIRPDGRVGGTICAHPTMERDWLPEPDVHVGQLLALTTDEAAFVRVANVHHGRRPPVAA